MKTNQKIPEGWSVKKLGKCVHIFGGYAYDSSECTSVGIKWLKIANVGKGKLEKSEFDYLPLEYKVNTKNYLLKKGDIVMALTRPITDNQLKIAYIDDDEYLLNQRVGKLLFSDDTCADFMYNKLTSSKIVCRISSLLIGTDPPNLTGNVLNQINILLPPLPEQEKIAGILGTWDEAIEKLSSLIEQKKLLKKGLMQRLLTGKTHLKGFTQPWEDYELSDLLDYEQPTKYLVNDILKYSKEKVPVLTANKAFILGSTDDTCGIYCKGNCIIFDDFTTDMKYVTFPFKVKSSAIKILTSKENVILKFVFEQMKRIKYPLGGHKRYYLSEYQYITIRVPDIAEQTAIADVLSTADEEIDLLNKKLEALKEQKKGLMQQLLTGQTRVKVN